MTKQSSKKKTTANAKKRQTFFSGDILALAFDTFKNGEKADALKAVLLAFESDDCEKLLSHIVKHNEKASAEQADDDSDADDADGEEEDDDAEEESSDEEKAGDDEDTDDSDEEPLFDGDDEEESSDDEDEDDDDSDEEEAKADPEIAEVLSSLYGEEPKSKKPAETAAAKKPAAKASKAAAPAKGKAAKAAAPAGKKTAKASTEGDKPDKQKATASRLTARMNLMSLSGTKKDRELASSLAATLKLKKDKGQSATK